MPGIIKAHAVALMRRRPPVECDRLRATHVRLEATEPHEARRCSVAPPHRYAAHILTTPYVQKFEHRGCRIRFVDGRRCKILSHSFPKDRCGRLTRGLYHAASNERRDRQ